MVPFRYFNYFKKLCFCEKILCDCYVRHHGITHLLILHLSFQYQNTSSVSARRKTKLICHIHFVFFGMSATTDKLHLSYNRGGEFTWEKYLPLSPMGSNLDPRCLPHWVTRLCEIALLEVMFRFRLIEFYLVMSLLRVCKSLRRHV